MGGARHENGCTSRWESPPPPPTLLSMLEAMDGWENEGGALRQIDVTNGAPDQATTPSTANNGRLSGVLLLEQPVTACLKLSMLSDANRTVGPRSAPDEV